MTTPDLVPSPTSVPVTLPLNPFVSNRYHFGMLLGVDDLETDQGYHRGKTWLHNAWLHGPGAVWGLGVEVDADRAEVIVHPGLALDGNGRELQVGGRMCLDLGRWFAERRPDDLDVVEQQGHIWFQVHVTLCARPCQDRPVPSISEPCSGSDLDTAYSRTVEQALPDLVGGPAPDEPVGPYRRLRELAGQLPVTDPHVMAAVNDIVAADPVDRTAVHLTWFRRLAALDSIDLGPDGGVGEHFPADDAGCIVLAQIDAHLRRDGQRWAVVADGRYPTSVDNTVRPTHVRTRTLQELLGPPRTVIRYAEGSGPYPGASAE